MPDLTTSLVFNPRENIKLSQGTHPIVYVGALLDDTAADPLADEEPVLAVLTAASVRGLTATGARAGQRLRRVLKDAATGVRTAPLCFASRGFWLPAATPIAGPDRRGLERLCRYVARPPWRGGVCAFSMPTLFPSRSKRRGRMGPALSCCLRWNCWRSGRLWFPRPGFISYATTGSWRPGPGPASASCRPSRLPSRRRAADGSASAASCGHRRRWATLLARVFSSDLSECAACGGRLRILAARTDPASIRTYLEGVGLPARAPPRAPPEPLFEFAA